MITQIQVSNYRSIGENLVLRLGKLTALVGPNGSGKSNLVDALLFIADALRSGLDAAVLKRRGFASIGRRNVKGLIDVCFDIEATLPDERRGGYRLELEGARSGEYRVVREYAYSTDVEKNQGWTMTVPRECSFEISRGRWIEGPDDLRPRLDPQALALPVLAADERFRPLAEMLRNVAVYSILPDALRGPQKPDAMKPMSVHGENWCSVIKELMQRNSGIELTAALGQITGDIDGVRVRAMGGYLVAQFRHGAEKIAHLGARRGSWHEAAQESDGALRIAGIIAALLQDHPLTIVGIEEPELTIHPGAIPLLYDYLAEASMKRQVLITTHSPELLSLLNADDVRVVERRDGVTTVTSMEESQRDAVRDRLLTLGDLMRMEGLRQEPSEQPAAAEG